jgi:hypothetical protein
MNDNKIIEFEDCGQDFLTWEIDGDGLVVKCEPFQGFVWEGCRVINHTRVKAGGNVWIFTKDKQTLRMNYKCISFKKAK